MFNDLSIDKAGTYTLVAAAANTIGGASDPFEIVGDHLGLHHPALELEPEHGDPGGGEFENPPGQIEYDGERPGAGSH